MVTHRFEYHVEVGIYELVLIWSQLCKWQQENSQQNIKIKWLKSEWQKSHKEAILLHFYLVCEYRRSYSESEIACELTVIADRFLYSTLVRVWWINKNWISIVFLNKFGHFVSLSGNLVHTKIYTRKWRTKPPGSMYLVGRHKTIIFVLSESWATIRERGQMYRPVGWNN